jgi:hypothetical protein
MGDADQPCVLVDGATQRLEIDLAVLIARDHLDPGAVFLGGLEVGDEVGGVLGFAGDDRVAWPLSNRVEGE